MSHFFTCSRDITISIWGELGAFLVDRSNYSHSTGAIHGISQGVKRTRGVKKTEVGVDHSFGTDQSSPRRSKKARKSLKDHDHDSSEKLITQIPSDAPSHANAPVAGRGNYISPASSFSPLNTDDDEFDSMPLLKKTQASSLYTQTGVLSSFLPFLLLLSLAGLSSSIYAVLHSENHFSAFFRPSLTYPLFSMISLSLAALSGVALAAALMVAAVKIDERHFIVKDAHTVYQQVMLIIKSRYYAAMRYTTADIFEHYVDKFADRQFLVSEDIVWKYKDCDFLANRLARWLKVGINCEVLSLNLTISRAHFVFHYF